MTIKGTMHSRCEERAIDENWLILVGLSCWKFWSDLIGWEIVKIRASGSESCIRVESGVRWGHGFSLFLGRVRY